MANIFPTDYSDKATPVAGDKLWGYDSESPSNKNISVGAINNLAFSSKSTTDLSEGTNLYYTDARVAGNTITLTNKTIDADGTGNVITNIGSAEVKSELVTGQTETAIASGDFLLFSDTSDSGNLKKVNVDNLPSAPSASETVEGIVERATDTEAIAKTDTTRYTSPAQFDKMLKDGFDAVYNLSTYGESSLFSGALTGISSFSGTSMVYACGMGRNSFSFNSTIDAVFFQNLLSQAPDTDLTLDLSEVDILELEFNGRLNPGGGSVLIGLSTGAPVTMYDITSTLAKVLLEYNGTNTLLNTADGTTQSNGNTFARANTGTTNYKIIFDVGTDVKIYEDGVLKDTKTTNLPTTGNWKVGFGYDRNASSGSLVFDYIRTRIKYV